MNIISLSKKYLPKPLLHLLKKIYQRNSLWFKIYALCSSRRVSSIRSCLKFGSEPLQMRAENILYTIDPVDSLQRRISMSSYENESLKQVMNCFKEQSGIFFDVGANVGFFALNLAKNCPNCQKVYAFEADPEIYERLKRNTFENQLQNFLKPINMAITSTCGNVTLYQNFDTSCSGTGSLHKFSDIEGKKITIKGTTVDTFVQEHQIKDIRCMKIDIEGNEIELLKGAQETIQKGIIKNFLIEFNGLRLSEIGVSFEEFISYFPQEKYKCSYNDQLLKALLSKKRKPEEICENFFFTRLE